MTGLIKNEIKLFFSRRNIILLILACIVVVILFHTIYESQYNRYHQQRLQELSNEIDNAEVWSARYTRRLERLKEEFPGHIKTPEAELMDQVWKDHLRSLTTLSLLWKEPVENEEKILIIEERLDENLIEVNKMQIETGDTRLYRDSERDWNKRIILLNKYKELGLELEINPLKPTAMYLLNDSINGRSYISILIIALVVLLNFDIWSKDFDNETLRLIFTLPHSKTKIFNIRFITRFILTLFLATLPIIILCILGLYKYGAEVDGFKIINSEALYTLGKFVSDNEIMQAYDIVTSVEKIAIYSGFIFLLFLFLIYAIVNFISYLSKNQQISILLSMVGLVILSGAFLVPSEVKNSAFNLLQFIDTNSLLTGALSFSWIWACSIFVITNLIIYFINLILINYKE